jgi:hypothetical protein
MSRSSGSGGNRVHRVLSATGGALVAIALAVSPAAAFTSTLKVTSSRFLGGVAADRSGDMFAVESGHNFGFNTLNGDNLIQLTPAGERVRTIVGKVPDGSYIRGWVAVTPDGGAVLLGGGATTDGSTFRQFVGEYSTSTGRFIRGATFDTDAKDDAGPLAVDSTGQYVYIADGTFKAGGPPNRVFQLDVHGLGTVRAFTLHGNAALRSEQVDGIAVGGPDDDVYVLVSPTSGVSFVQIYQPDGTFVSQFTTQDSGGIAVDPVGEIFLSGANGISGFRGDGSPTGLRIATGPRSFVEAVNSSDQLFAFEWPKNDVGGSIVKFAPQIPETAITSELPPPGARLLLDSPTATFKFKSPNPGATFECRLDRRGFDVAPFSPCTSPLTYNGNPNGDYAFAVRAVSIDGAPDPTPAEVRFVVDATYARAVITSHPAALIGHTHATFKFGGTLPGVTFKCRLTKFLQKPHAFKPCSSPATYDGLVHDVYSFQVEAITDKGYVQPNATGYRFAVDPVPPVVAAPVASIAEGQQLGPVGGTSVTLSWSATDPNTLSPELLGSLQERSGPSAGSLGAFSTIAGADRVAGLTSTALAIPPGTTRYQFRALAENKLRLVGESPRSSAFGLSLIDQGEQAVSYSSGWATVTSSQAVGGTVVEAKTAGAHATLRFTGTSIGVIGVPAPHRGELKVCIDPGTSAQHCSDVATSASGKTERELVYTRNGLTDGRHTIEITADSAAPVVLDGFVLLT